MATPEEIIKVLYDRGYDVSAVPDLINPLEIDPEERGISVAIKGEWHKLVFTDGQNKEKEVERARAALREPSTLRTRV